MPLKLKERIEIIPSDISKATRLNQEKSATATGKQSAEKNARVFGFPRVPNALPSPQEGSRTCDTTGSKPKTCATAYGRFTKMNPSTIDRIAEMRSFSGKCVVTYPRKKRERTDINE